MKTYERPQVFCQEDLCEGCPADNGSFCTLTKGYTTGDKDYRPTWERNGESPDKIIEQEAVTNRRPLTAPYVPFGIRRFQQLTCTD